jgi:hypothetical protein
VTHQAPSLGKTAQAFVGAVTEGAQVLAEQLRPHLAKAGASLKDDSDTGLLLRCLLYTVHLTDRFALAQLGFAGREQFMGALLAELVKNGGADLIRPEYNNFQREFGQYGKFLPDGDAGYGGTLCWEFTKAIVAEFCPTSAQIIPLLTYEASTHVTLVGKTFAECVPQS